MTRRIPFSVLALACLCACGAAPPSPSPPFQARRVVELQRWQAFAGADRLGDLLELRIEDPARPVRFYQVVDPGGRIVGSATEAGRFSRRVPFQDEEQDIGVWSLARGVAELFESAGPVELRVVPREASAERR